MSPSTVRRLARADFAPTGLFCCAEAAMAFIEVNARFVSASTLAMASASVTSRGSARSAGPQ